MQGILLDFFQQLIKAKNQRIFLYMVIKQIYFGLYLFQLSASKTDETSLHGWVILPYAPMKLSAAESYLPLTPMKISARMPFKMK